MARWGYNIMDINYFRINQTMFNYVHYQYMFSDFSFDAMYYVRSNSIRNLIYLFIY